MHFPVDIAIGPAKILLHNITEFLGFFIGFRYFLYLRKKQGDIIGQPNRVSILIAAIFGAFIGSRLVGGLEDPVKMIAADNVFVYFYQQKTVLGGFLGGLLSVELVKKIIGERTASGDLFTYPIILALIIGRIGCFSMGVYEETYGLPTTLPWGIKLGDAFYRHPVALYEVLFLVLLWFTLLQLEVRYALQNGARFKLFMIAYCLFRFMLDFVKPHYTFGFGLSTIQVTALLGLLYYYRYMVQPASLIVQKRQMVQQAIR
ncbi:prolipoprotein diacylglyceryl transferase [Panacibacter sp. DH6]|uniref:Prolipoprotein diacylglyceryl transferase n=1 Tax=Panacibacter microcysteis TaxID=2793269 RepID=A0A931GYL9_9BACT|nr:prolipoprotein diacylglyceryl transferase family protein [Panacibacter microcysteis]MBG9376692.1 prolipoprotein diacylglyceryl transferase [Panacibacter microcysteis]